MSEVFISLARKWRPRSLADMVGQEYVVRALQNAARDNRLHHALLFSGTRGIGKTTLARITAMLINCEGRAADAIEPCLQCGVCADIMAGRLTDVIEQDAASHTQVDKMRELLESAGYAPARAAYKVFIIDEVHMLTKQSFNAMLKTLEEPPPHVKFILATTDPQKLPATVRSRCLCFSLLPLTPAQISERLAHILQAEGVPFQAAATAAVARLAAGSMRDALSILDQAVAHRDGELKADDVRRMTGDIGADMLADILRAVADGSAEGVSDIAARHIAHHVSFDVSLSRLAALIYKISLAQALPKARVAEDDEEAEIIREMSGRLSAEALQVLYEIALRARQQLPLAPDAATGFTMALLRMTLFAPAGPAAAAAAASAPSAPAPGALPSSPPPPPPPPPSSPAVAAASPPASPPPLARQSRWRQTIDQLGDMGRALAMHCIAEDYTDSGIVLVVDNAHAASADKFLPHLTDDLKRLHGDDFAVHCKAAADNAAAAEEQARLEEQARNAGLTRAIQKNFPDAALVEGSARADGA